MAQKRIYELTEDTAPTADHSLALDKSGNAAATRVTITNLLQKLRVGLQSYGGNARGTGAVDLQITRLADAQVASGNYASLPGGQYNTASGLASVAAGGSLNTASGGYSGVLGGTANVASGTGAVALGGQGNQATGFRAMASGGSALAPLRYQHAHGGGQFGAVGDAQWSRMVAIRQVTHSGSTWYDLLVEATSRLSIPADTLWQFRIMLVGVTAGAAQRWAYEIIGAIVNDGGSVALVGSPTVTVISESDAAYECQAIANDTNDALAIQVRNNGGSAYTVRWVASVDVVEVAFP